MFKLLIAVSALAVATPSVAQSSHAVRGYTRADGTYVAPTRATNPNDTRLDNYSTRGNVNPSNGREGTVDPYRTPGTQPSYNPYKSQRF